MSQYIVIENFFLKETFSKVCFLLFLVAERLSQCCGYLYLIAQAVKMSTVSSDGKTTSVVDDGFYIIHKCLRYTWEWWTMTVALISNSCLNFAKTYRHIWILSTFNVTFFLNKNEMNLAKFVAFYDMEFHLQGFLLYYTLFVFVIFVRRSFSSCSVDGACAMLNHSWWASMLNSWT